MQGDTKCYETAHVCLIPAKQSSCSVMKRGRNVIELCVGRVRMKIVALDHALSLLWRKILSANKMLSPYVPQLWMIPQQLCVLLGYQQMQNHSAVCQISGLYLRHC